MKQPFNPTPKGLTLLEIVDYFPTDDKAREHLESMTWPNGPACPHCGTNDQDRISKVAANPEKKVRAGLYCCKDCRKQFTVTVNTIFADTHIPLRKWLIAWYLLCASKKGVSSLQIQRMLDLGSYKSALFMMHRIRYALQDPVFTDPLKGVVEIDETYVGGKTKGMGAHYMGNKTPVVSLVERGGNKRSFAFDNERVTGKNINKVVAEHVHGTATVNTDESLLYSRVKRTHKHASVNHSKEEYVRMDGEDVVTTNTVESSFSLLKRGVVGTFHNISKKHLPLYLSEFDHRWNTRHDSDTERTNKGLRKVRGKRITYAPLTKSSK